MAFSERVTRLKSSLIREILAAAQRPQVMSFAGGLPAEAMLPALNWDGMPLNIGQYGMSEGEPKLRELLAAEARALGVACQASQVLVVSGSQQTLDLAASCTSTRAPKSCSKARLIWRPCRSSNCSAPSA